MKMLMKMMKNAAMECTLVSVRTRWSYLRGVTRVCLEDLILGNR